MSAHLVVPRNQLGRDFTVGDVHGCVDLVHRALDRVNFDPAIDRLFLVGDLIDRGADSARSVRLLRNPFVHAVAGNHERMLIASYAGEEVDIQSLLFDCKQNGMAWWLDVTDEVRQDVLDLIRPLPHAMETDTVRGRVGFVHAEVPRGMNWATFVERIRGGDGHVREQAVWGRSRIRHGDDSGVEGIDRVFVGHTVVNGPMRLGNVYHIDTGAVFGVLEQDPGMGFLTIVDLTCRTDVLMNVTKNGSLVTTRESPSDQPFGNYAMSRRLHP